jgi:hypothetical protein
MNKVQFGSGGGHGIGHSDVANVNYGYVPYIDAVLREGMSHETGGDSFLSGASGAHGGSSHGKPGDKLIKMAAIGLAALGAWKLGVEKLIMGQLRKLRP